MDVVSAGIDWCRTSIAARDDRFTFSRSDFYHPLYNPGGRETATAARFPAEDASVDFVVATSLFTHLSRGVFERYLAEAARILAVGGRLFATFFLINREDPRRAPRRAQPVRLRTCPNPARCSDRPAATCSRRWRSMRTG